MATFKAEVYAHQRKADGTYNIKIRITQNRRKKYLATTYYVTKEDLTRSMKLKNQKYIDATDSIIRKYRSVCDRVGERLKNMTVEQVVELITSSIDEHFDLDIVDYATKYITHLKNVGRNGTARVYETAINSLKKFAGREKISIHEITVKFLNDWVVWIGKQPAITKKERGTRAQSLYVAQLRAIHNRAKKEFNDEDAGIIRIPYSPFKKVELPTPTMPRKRAIPVDLLRKLSKLPYMEIVHYPGNNLFNLAKDVFLLSFYLVGMNAVDLYNCKSDCYKNGRITYQRTKTKTRRMDKAEISIKVEPEALPLIEKYKDPTGERIFNFHLMYASTSFSRALNDGLKLIGKVIEVEGLEFYAARHTWATIAINDVGIDKYTVHTALNHVDEKMKITDTYIKKSWRPIDEANRKVIDFAKLAVYDTIEYKKTK